MIFAILPLDDLPVPIIPLLHRGVFQSVVRTARPYFGGAPDILGKGAINRHRLNVVDKGLVTRPLGVLGGTPLPGSQEEKRTG